MSENVLQTTQKFIQDVLAPDVRETKVRLEELEKRMDSRFESLEKRMDARFEAVDTRFKSVDARFDSLEKQMQANTDSLLSAIRETRAQTELSTMQAVAELRERVAVLESKHTQAA